MFLAKASESLNHRIVDFVQRQGAAFPNQIAISVGISLDEVEARLKELVKEGLLSSSAAPSNTAVYTPNWREIQKSDSLKRQTA